MYKWLQLVILGIRIAWLLLYKKTVKNKKKITCITGKVLTWKMKNKTIKQQRPVSRVVNERRFKTNIDIKRWMLDRRKKNQGQNESSSKRQIISWIRIKTFDSSCYSMLPGSVWDIHEIKVFISRLQIIAEYEGKDTYYVLHVGWDKSIDLKWSAVLNSCWVGLNGTAQKVRACRF